MYQVKCHYITKLYEKVVIKTSMRFMFCPSLQYCIVQNSGKGKLWQMVNFIKIWWAKLWRIAMNYPLLL